LRRGMRHNSNGPSVLRASCEPAGMKNNNRDEEYLY
jgi:hypothetical protein